MQKYISWFLKRVRKTRGCWFWGGVHNAKGYGYCFYLNRMPGAHRVAYQIFKGVIPEGMLVLHSCDRVNCVNPKHLRIGTYKDNSLEASTKGHLKGGPGFVGGDKHPQAVHKFRDIQKMRKLRAQLVSRREVAKLFAIS